MYSYAGQHEDELAFNVGDIITLISKEEEAWWKGELDGNQGVFPSNYVEELNCKYIFKWVYIMEIGFFLFIYLAHGTAATNPGTMYKYVCLNLKILPRYIHLLGPKIQILYTNISLYCHFVCLF